jgi:hypothetical protein
MTLKNFLKRVDIKSVKVLLLARKLLLAAADAAEQLYAAETLEKICNRWTRAGLPDDLKIDLYESAGEENDDRNRITITVLTKDEELATRAIMVFAGSDYGKEDAEDVDPTTVWGDPAFTWEPGPAWPSHFRKVMDAVAEMSGPYQDTRITIAQIQHWVWRVRAKIGKLVK